MIAIACIDNNNAIGKDGKLLISIPDDMSHFRMETKDSIVIMGRKTLFSFKDKKPLKNRINVVFTNNAELKNEYKDYDNIYFINKKDELLKIIDKYKDKKCYLIGGAKIYNDLIDMCDICDITKVYKTFPADSYFPDIEKNGFTIKEQSEIFDYEGIKYQFIKYEKSK